MRAASEEKSDHQKDIFCEELEQAFDYIPKYHIKILLEYFEAKDE